MPVSSAQQPYLLTESQNRLLFFEEILPNAFDETASVVSPRAIFLGGQPGSGKSGLSMLVQQTFAETERAVVVNSDALREYHPHFALLQKTDPERASFLVNPDTVLWQQKLITAVIETKRNIVLDGTLGGNPAPILTTIRFLREAGYEIQVSVLAVPARLSRLGIYKRYEDQLVLKGLGRWVGMENHDRVYREIPKTTATLEDQKVVDRIQIYARQNSLMTPALLYENHLKNDQWTLPGSAEKALTESRNRLWTAEEQDAFVAAVQAVAERMRQREVSQADIENFYRYVECPL